MVSFQTLQKQLLRRKRKRRNQALNGMQGKHTQRLVNAFLGKRMNGKTSGGLKVRNRARMEHGAFGEKLIPRTISVLKCMLQETLIKNTSHKLRISWNLIRVKT